MLAHTNKQAVDLQLKKIKEIEQQLKDEYLNRNKRCVITVTDLSDYSTQYHIIRCVCEEVCRMFDVSLHNLMNWKKTANERIAKKMIVFILINRCSIPIKDVSNYMGISSQSISYMSLNPFAVYKINNYENIVNKVEEQLKENLLLLS